MTKHLDRHDVVDEPIQASLAALEATFMARCRRIESRLAALETNAQQRRRIEGLEAMLLALGTSDVARFCFEVDRHLRETAADPAWPIPPEPARLALLADDLAGWLAKLQDRIADLTVDDWADCEDTALSAAVAPDRNVVRFPGVRPAGAAT